MEDAEVERLRFGADFCGGSEELQAYPLDRYFILLIDGLRCPPLSHADTDILGCSLFFILALVLILIGCGKFVLCFLLCYKLLLPDLCVFELEGLLGLHDRRIVDDIDEFEESGQELSFHLNIEFLHAEAKVLEEIHFLHINSLHHAEMHKATQSHFGIFL